jgi:2,3,4,5-tetrahydropyridine-2-carboxylate N-succinyltransferase
MLEQKIIEEYWEHIINDIDSKLNIEEVRRVISDVIDMLDKGIISMHEKKTDGTWHTIDWMRKAVVLYIKISPSQVIESKYFDKVPLKFTSWRKEDFDNAKIRIVPGAVVRYGAFISQNCVIMPSFVNIGSCINVGTMIDINVTVGSCAYIGEKCHISAGTTIGGILEPLSAQPVIIEDNVFIGANCSITEGITIGSGSVLASGVHISASTKIYDTTNDTINYGCIPNNAVVVQGAVPNTDNNYYTSCALIKKYADAKTRERVCINNLLR